MIQSAIPLVLALRRMREDCLPHIFPWRRVCVHRVFRSHLGLLVCGLGSFDPKWLGIQRIVRSLQRCRSRVKIMLSSSAPIKAVGTKDNRIDFQSPLHSQLVATLRFDEVTGHSPYTFRLQVPLEAPATVPLFAKEGEARE